MSDKCAIGNEETDTQRPLAGSWKLHANPERLAPELGFNHHTHIASLEQKSTSYYFYPIISTGTW
jgi:hypothetical protein